MKSATTRLFFTLFAAAALTIGLVDGRAAAADPLVFISAFTRGEDGMIAAFRLDEASGQLQPLHRTSDVEHPFFMALSPNQKYLYSIHAKSFGGKEHEEVAAYRIEGTNGKLQLLNRQSARGSAACYLDVDDDGHCVLVANYTTGSVAALPIQDDGSLGQATSFVQHAGSSIDSTRQEGPHAHCIVVSPDNRFAFAADLGLDQILCYRLDPATAKLSPNQQPFVRTPPGAGPRHLTFHPNGRHLYVINELKNSITLFDYQTESGILIERQTISTLPSDFAGTSYCADLKVTPDSKFLYGTNRGHDSIAAYEIADDGTLALIAIEPSGGKGPQNLAFSPGGKLLLCANMPGNNVSVFKIDPQTGRLKPAGDPISIKMPSCIMIVP